MADIENSDEAVNPLGTAAGGDGGGNEPPATGGSSGLSEYDGPTIDISEEMRQSYLGYAMSTIVSRALPDVRDGLKPVQRRILYAMRELGLSPNSRHLKSAKVVGETMGNYHPHGDQARYGTMVRMAQPFSLRYPLVDGQGNFGSVDDDPPAAMRYTEARLTALAMEMMEDIEKDTVDFIPTYDNERREPSILPGKFPNLICNGSSGIAVGMATNMPPHNLREICDAITYLIDNNNATVPELMQFVKGPDFPTSGMVYGTRGIISAYETGRGSVTMQAKTHLEPMDNGKTAIVITELPYQVVKSRLIEHIGELARDKKIEGITGINDYTDKSEMRVVVELKRDVQPHKILNQLLKHTQLRLNFGCILLSLVDRGRGPKVLGLRGMLQEYIDHRREIITRRTKFEVNRAKQRAHILEGLQIAVLNLDEVIRTIRASANTDQARSALMAKFGFTGPQTEAILNMQLRQLTALEQDKIENEYKELLKEIGRLESILSDPKRVDQLIKDDLIYLRNKFGDDRRTEIVATEAENLRPEDMIAEEETLITISASGYIKRMKLTSFAVNHRGGKGKSAGKTKEDDSIEHIFRANTHEQIMFFTDKGKVYRLKAYDVPERDTNAMGSYLGNLLNVESGERVTAYVSVRDLANAEGYLLMGSRLGEIKRCDLKDFKNIRANGVQTFDLNEGDELGWVRKTTGDSTVILCTSRGHAIRFAESDVRCSGRTSGGVRGITLDGPDDVVVAMDVAEDDADLLVVGENGVGKRSGLVDYKVQSRGGKGLKTIDVTVKTGPLKAACIVSGASDKSRSLLIMSENGQATRFPVKEAKKQGRSTQGVKLINLAENDKVARVTVVVTDPLTESGL